MFEKTPWSIVIEESFWSLFISHDFKVIALICTSKKPNKVQNVWIRCIEAFMTDYRTVWTYSLILVLIPATVQIWCFAIERSPISSVNVSLTRNIKMFIGYGQLLHEWQTNGHWSSTIYDSCEIDICRSISPMF